MCWSRGQPGRFFLVFSRISCEFSRLIADGWSRPRLLTEPFSLRVVKQTERMRRGRRAEPQAAAESARFQAVFSLSRKVGAVRSGAEDLGLRLCCEEPFFPL